MATKPSMGKYTLFIFCEACKHMEFFYYDFNHCCYRCKMCNINQEGQLWS